MSLEMLASKKVITSQVDRGKLERTIARQKRRAEKRAGSVVSAQKPGKKYSAAAAKKLLDASMLEAMLMTESSNEGGANLRDIKLESFDIALGGKRILTDAFIDHCAWQTVRSCGKEWSGQVHVIAVLEYKATGCTLTHFNPARGAGGARGRGDGACLGPVLRF